MVCLSRVSIEAVALQLFGGLARVGDFLGGGLWLLEQRDLGWTCRRMVVDLLCTGPPTGDHQAGRQAGRQAGGQSYCCSVRQEDRRCKAKCRSNVALTDPRTDQVVRRGSRVAKKGKRLRVEAGRSTLLGSS